MLISTTAARPGVGQDIRAGYKRLLSGVGIHSIGGTSDCILYRRGSGLYRYDRLTGDSILLRDGIASLQRMWYLPLYGARIYYSDGVVTGCVQDGKSQTWGIMPPPAPSVVPTAGNLKAGRYHVCLAYASKGGQVSGSSPFVAVDIDDNGGTAIAFQRSADSRIYGVNIYMTTPNGSTMFYVTTSINGDGVYFYRGSAHEFYRTLEAPNCYPPPPGQLIEFYKGRIYVASGNIVYYSRPHSYELFEIASDYLPF